MAADQAAKPVQEAGRSRSDIDWDRRGLVFDIRRFSTHDGPGIRTSVFTKGCPLRCLWCQNPEGIELKRNLFYFREKCIGCGTCVAHCPQKAIRKVDDKIAIDRSLCDLCGICVDVCPPQALSFDSREMTVREVVNEVLLDRPFYRDNGGLTITGGDPVVQHAFNVQVLKACRSYGIHTAIETSLFADRNVLESLLPHINLLIADFKVFDEQDHLAWTGVSNDRIKRNFEWIILRMRQMREQKGQRAGHQTPDPELLVRIPMIPGHNTTLENLRQTGAYFYRLDPTTRIELLNYNPLAMNKYVLLEQPYLFDQNPRMFTQEEMADFVLALRETGVVAFAEPSR